MTKEELKKEAEEYVCKRNPLVTKEWFIDAFKKYDKGEKVKYLKDCEIAEYEAYIAGAEPREKKIEVLEELLDECGNSINEFREEIKSIGERCLQLQKDKGNLIDRVKELEAQIEKLIDFVLSKTECCDICPITDTCINSEGTCPYAGILAKGEEEVTREWLMQFISRR